MPRLTETEKQSLVRGMAHRGSIERYIVSTIETINDLGLSIVSIVF